MNKARNNKNETPYTMLISMKMIKNVLEIKQN